MTIHVALNMCSEITHTYLVLNTILDVCFYSLFVDGDSDLKLAILLSLQDAPADTATSPPTDNASKEDSILSAPRTAPSGDPFSPQYTTVVTRVPNRSVEDLVTGFEGGVRVDVSPPLSLGRTVSVSPPRSCSELPEGAMQRRRIHSSPPPSSRDINCAEFLATCSRITGGGQQPGQSSSSEDISLLPPVDAVVECDFDDVAELKGNPFGLIKDIRVTNIVSEEHDKTKEFATKDLRYVLSDVSVDSFMRDDIFEPRQLPIVQDDIVADDDGVTQLTSRGQRLYQLEAGDEVRNNCRAHIGSREMAAINIGHNDLDKARRQRNSPCCHGDVNILLDNVQVKEERQRIEGVVQVGVKEAASGANGAEESADELVINSEVLESLLQGAEQYLHDNNNPAVNLPLLPLKRHSQGEPPEDESDTLCELTIEEHCLSMRHSSERCTDDAQTRRLLLSPEYQSDDSDEDERDAVFV